MNSHDLTTINFHGATLVAIRGETDATTLVAMRPVAEGMGLDWSSQRRKLAGHPVLETCMVVMTMQMPGDDQAREWVFLPLNRLNFWLATVHPNRVTDPAIRAKVIEYQEECAEALYQHFFAKAQRAARARMAVDERRVREKHLLDKMRGIQGFAGELRRSCGQRYAAALFPQLLRELGMEAPNLTAEPFRQGELFDEPDDEAMTEKRWPN